MRVRMGRCLGVFLLGLGVLGTVTMVRCGVDMKMLWETVRSWSTVLLAAVIHECGHFLAAWGAGVQVRGMRLDLFGARMELEGLLSYGREFLVAAGGPIASLLAACLAYPLWAGYGWESAGLFMMASALLGCVNLLPVGTLDGGRMLSCGVAWMWGERAAHRIRQIFTGLFLGALWMLAVYALLRAGQMLSLFVFSLGLLVRSAGGGEG